MARPDLHTKATPYPASLSWSQRSFLAPFVATAIAAILLLCLSRARADDPPPTAAALDASNLQPMQTLRDWWIEGPGGRYGLMELTTHSVWSDPRAKIRRTTLLLGPWHWTLDASAPQALTVIIIVVLVGAFVSGWIRTKRYAA